MKKAGTFKILENWKFDLVDAYTGQLIESEEICNTIVNDGLERVARMIVGDNLTYFRAIAIGTGTNSVNPTDTQLQIEFTRALATLSYQANYQAKLTHTFTFGSGVSQTITEAGIFDSNTVSGSKMLARTTFSGKSVTNAVTLIVTATISVARA
jgi:hypothetical protein